MRPSLLLSLVLLTTVATTGGAESTDEGWYFRYEGVPLYWVLDDLEATTGASFELHFEASDPVDVDFSARSLDAGLKRLLGDYNYVLQYRRDQVTQERYPHVILLGRKADRRSEPNTTAVASSPPPPVTSAELVLRREGQQPYSTQGSINGRTVNFLIDTGASVVALSESLARRLGLRFGARRTVSTANGQTSGHQTVLPDVQLGPELVLGQVEAIILPRMSMQDHVLLGMNVLERFELIQSRGELTIRPH